MKHLRLENFICHIFRSFTEMPPVLFELVSLTSLLVTGNKLTKIDHEGLANLNSLETLDLSMNDIIAVPPELGLMVHLKLV